MQIIYAAGPSGALEFAIADSKDAVPSNAIVFAVCSEERALLIQDEDLLDTLIDRELATFQTLLREAREVELKLLPLRRSFGRENLSDGEHVVASLVTQKSP